MQEFSSLAETPDVDYFGTIENTTPAGGTPGYVLHAVDITTTDSVITLAGPGATPFTGTGDGILIQRVDATDANLINGTGCPGHPPSASRSMVLRSRVLDQQRYGLKAYPGLQPRARTTSQISQFLARQVTAFCFRTLGQPQHLTT